MVHADDEAKANIPIASQNRDFDPPRVVARTFDPVNLPWGEFSTSKSGTQLLSHCTGCVGTFTCHLFLEVMRADPT